MRQLKFGEKVEAIPGVETISDLEDSDDEFDPVTGKIRFSQLTIRRMMERKNADEGLPTVQLEKPSVIKVTHYTPVHNPHLLRERSISALEAVRKQAYVEKGRLPRVIFDVKAGCHLPREDIFDGDKEAAKLLAGQVNTEEERSNLQEDMDSKNVSYHYRRSVDALEALRDVRLMRKLGL